MENKEFYKRALNIIGLDIEDGNISQGLYKCRHILDIPHPCHIPLHLGAARYVWLCLGVASHLPLGVQQQPLHGNPPPSRPPLPT